MCVTCDHYEKRWAYEYDFIWPVIVVVIGLRCFFANMELEQLQFMLTHEWFLLKFLVHVSMIPRQIVLPYKDN